METFTGLKPFIDNPDYALQREQSLASLDLAAIDPPIVEVILGFAGLPYCFTLQSCYGHFVYRGQDDRYHVAPLPASEDRLPVEYRIAYVALCLENSDMGRRLFQDLEGIPYMDPEYIQFGCAEWFWKRQVNSYALQVEPKRHMRKDSVRQFYEEALHIERVRSRFFAELKRLLQERQPPNRGSSSL